MPAYKAPCNRKSLRLAVLPLCMPLWIAAPQPKSLPPLLIQGCQGGMHPLMLESADPTIGSLNAPHMRSTGNPSGNALQEKTTAAGPGDLAKSSERYHHFVLEH